MKTILKLCALAVLLAGLPGCRNVGYNDQSLNNDMTSGVAPKGFVRSYDQNGNPTVTPAPTPGATDPASPNYRSANGSN